jgi:predicted acetyltransferase
MSEVALVEVGEDDKPVLANLLQLYCYDFSELRRYEVTDHGLFVYRHLDLYFLEPDRHAFLVRAGGALAGFALSRLLPSGEHEVAEFFVMRRHRRSGVGRRAAHLLLAQQRGDWVLRFDVDNVAAAALWTRVAAEVAVGDVRSEQLGPPHQQHRQTVLRFSNR